MNWTAIGLYSFLLIVFLSDLVIVATFGFVTYEIGMKLYGLKRGKDTIDESLQRLAMQLIVLGIGVLRLTDILHRFSPISVSHTAVGFVVLIPT